MGVVDLGGGWELLLNGIVKLLLGRWYMGERCGRLTGVGPIIVPALTSPSRTAGPLETPLVSVY